MAGRHMHVVLVLLVLIGVSWGWQNGFDTNRCDDMRPIPYSYSEQQGPSPYTLSTPEYYGSRSIYRITISGDNFEAYMIEARLRGTNVVVGKFGQLPSNGARSLSCPSNYAVPGNAVTNSNRNTKGETTFSWEAPTSDVGLVEFVATIVKNERQYWLKLTSRTASFTNDPVLAGATDMKTSFMMTFVCFALAIILFH